MSGLEEKHREEVIVEEQGRNWLPAKNSTKNALDFRYNEVWVCMVIASATVKYVSIIVSVFEECVREQINWVLCISCVQHGMMFIIRHGGNLWRQAECENNYQAVKTLENVRISVVKCKQTCLLFSQWHVS